MTAAASSPTVTQSANKTRGPAAAADPGRRNEPCAPEPTHPALGVTIERGARRRLQRCSAAERVHHVHDGDHLGGALDREIRSVVAPPVPAALRVVRNDAARPRKRRVMKQAPGMRDGERWQPPCMQRPPASLARHRTCADPLASPQLPVTPSGGISQWELSSFPAYRAELQPRSAARARRAPSLRGLSRFAGWLGAGRVVRPEAPSGGPSRRHRAAAWWRARSCGAVCAGQAAGGDGPSDAHQMPVRIARRWRRECCRGPRAGGRSRRARPATFSSRAGAVAPISFGRPVLPPLVTRFHDGDTPGGEQPP